MIGAALVVPLLLRSIGHPAVLGMVLVLVALRGMLAAHGGSWWNIAVFQVMEGMSMGQAGVAIPALAARVMENTGHAGAGLAA